MKTKKNLAPLIAVIAGVILVIALTASVLVSVPTGHTGVLVTFGHVEDFVYGEGMHFKLPWQELVCMDNRTQKANLKLQAFSSDIQQVDVACSVNYSVDRETSQNLYRNVGKYYYDTVMEPRIYEDVKAVFAKYTADSLISNRDSLSAQIMDILAPELKAYGIEVISISIENIDFSDAFTDAVEAKQVAEQAKLQAQIEQDQKNMEQKALAERQMIAAQAEADIAVIQATAEKEVLQIQADAAEYAGQKDAAVNHALSSSLNEILIRYYQIKQWDGKMPTVLLGGDGQAFPILDLSDLAE